jgi:osmotically-inducible protein OsmY
VEFTMAERTQKTKTKAGAQTAGARNPDWDFYRPEGRGQTDEQIRADIHEAMRGESGDNTTAFSVSVADGIVTLSGGVRTAGEQRRLIDLVRAVPSVKEVRDQTRV